jgi:tRNA(fMet)-specific endonuclease VapC
MALYLLDSDIMTLWLYGNAKVRARFDAVTETDRVAISLITRAELLRGRFESVLKAADRTEWLQAQERLLAAEKSLAKVEVVLITEKRPRISSIPFARARSSTKWTPATGSKPRLRSRMGRRS